MKNNIFEPNNPLIKLKNIEVIKNNKYTEFTYAEGGIDSEISFYFEGTELEIISDLCWNRSNNILVKIDNKEYRYDQRSKDIKLNKIYYKRSLIDITDIPQGIHFVKICLDEKSTRGKDNKFTFTIDTIRCNGKLVDSSDSYIDNNVKIIKNQNLEAFLQGNKNKEIIFTDNGKIYIADGNTKILCNGNNSNTIAPPSNTINIPSLPEF